MGRRSGVADSQYELTANSCEDPFGILRKYTDIQQRPLNKYPEASNRSLCGGRDTGEKRGTEATADGQDTGIVTGCREYGVTARRCDRGSAPAIHATDYG